MTTEPSVPDGVEVTGSAFAVLPEVVLYSDVSPRAVCLYAVLQRFVNLPRGAIPSRQTLADKLGCSRASLDRATKELEDAGFLEVENRFLPNTQGRTSSRFHLLIPVLTREDRSIQERGEVSSPVTTKRKRRSESEDNPGSAQSELMERNRRRREGQPACEKCADAGVWIDDAGAHQCECVA